MDKKHSKNNSKDQRRSKDTKWVGPRDTIAGMKEKGGEKANGFEPEPKPSSPYSTTPTSLDLRPRNA